MLTVVGGSSVVCLVSGPPSSSASMIGQSPSSVWCSSIELWLFVGVTSFSRGRVGIVFNRLQLCSIPKRE